MMLEDVCSAIEEDRNFGRVPDKIASPFIAVEHAFVSAVTFQIGQSGGREILRLRCMQTGRRRKVTDAEKEERGHDGNVQPALILEGIVRREDMAAEFD